MKYALIHSKENELKVCAISEDRAKLESLRESLIKRGAINKKKNIDREEEYYRLYHKNSEKRREFMRKFVSDNYHAIWDVCIKKYKPDHLFHKTIQEKIVYLFDTLTVPFVYELFEQYFDVRYVHNIPNWEEFYNEERPKFLTEYTKSSLKIRQITKEL